MAILRGISIDEYHSGPNVSHSKLETFAERGPGYYHARYLAKTLEREETAALTFGNAFELYFQQGEEAFERAVATRPDGHGNTKAVQAAKAAAKATGKLAVSPAERETMRCMAASLREHDMASLLIAAAEQQLTLTAELYGRTYQSRPDWLVTETGFGQGPVSIDLKTAKDLNDFSDTGIVKMGYHTQAALVRRLCRLNGLGDATCYLLAVEKVPVYRCELIELPGELLDLGDRGLEVYAPKLAECYERNHWPRARPGIRRAGVPRWLQQEQAA